MAVPSPIHALQPTHTHPHPHPAVTPEHHDHEHGQRIRPIREQSDPQCSFSRDELHHGVLPAETGYIHKKREHVPRTPSIQERTGGNWKIRYARCTRPLPASPSIMSDTENKALGSAEPSPASGRCPSRSQAVLPPPGNPCIQARRAEGKDERPIPYASRHPCSIGRPVKKAGVGESQNLDARLMSW